MPGHKVWAPGEEEVARASCTLWSPWLLRSFTHTPSLSCLAFLSWSWVPAFSFSGETFILFIKFEKEVIFEGFQPPEMRGKRKYKSPELYIWFSFCSQNYRRMIKRFILSFWFIARFGYIFLQISPLFLLVPMYDSHKTFLKKHWDSWLLSLCCFSGSQTRSITLVCPLLQVPRWGP
jgi:hypothetical protein